MNVLFMTIGRMESIEAHSIYADLLRCFRDHGHAIYTISPHEKRSGKNTELVEESGAHLLHIKTGNVTGGANVIEKGLAQLSLESTFIEGIKRYFSDVKFDLVLYSTPPITFCKAVEFVKKRDGAKTYLLLKDIFPQNAVDVGLIRTRGLKGLLYSYFRHQEKKLYKISDRIGCMSAANVDYVLNNNPEVDPSKVEVCPNAVEPLDNSVDEKTRISIRKKYEIPIDKKVFVYGGNLGKPQGIPFLIECLKECKDISKAFFLIVGEGSEYGKLEKFVNNESPKNVNLLKRLPKDDYDKMVGACDVGLIFLDHRFTIPNFPSRLLAYMQAKIPVIAVTDPCTDIGKVIAEGGFGWWCESKEVKGFRNVVSSALNQNLEDMKEAEWQFLLDNYTTERAYSIIMRH